MIPSGYLPGWSPYYYEYYLPGTKIYFSSESKYGRLLIGVNAKTKKLETCLAFLDMFSNPDEMMMITRMGPQGEFWYVDDTRNAFFTEAGLRHLESFHDSAGFALKSGEKLELWNTPWIGNSGALTGFTDGLGNIRIVDHIQWRERQELYMQKESYRRWQAVTGYHSWKEWLMANNAFYSESPLSNITGFTSIPDDAMQFIIAALGDTVVTASWKMV